jgi:protein involved in polysaccharide export with SLBB domain
MNIRPLLILALVLAPCVLRAQGGAVIRKGDTLELQLSGVPPDETALFSGHTYPVDEQEGTINLNYIGQIKVDGLSANAIQELIEKRYVDEKIFTHPIITVQANTVPRFVNVLGEVKSGGARIPYTADLTLIGVITAGGGFTDFADKKRVELMRDGTKTVYNTLNIQNGKAEDPKVLPGDKITVKQGW